MASQLVTMDTLDDRRELWHLLHRLPPVRRVAFLAWCCTQVSGPGGTRPGPSSRNQPAVAAARLDDKADERLTNMMYGDLLMLGAQWGLDLAKAAVTLESWVKRPASVPKMPRVPARIPCSSGSSRPVDLCRG